MTPSSASLRATLSQCLLAAVFTSAEAQAAPVLLDLPAQPLATSLEALTAASAMKLEADPALLAGRDAPALTGGHEPAAALAALLEGSGLEASRRDDGAYVIAAAPDSQRVERIDVRGHHERAARPSSLRLDVPLLDAPMSVQVVDRELIQLQGILDPMDAMTNVPGAVRGASFTGLGEAFIVRGFVQPDIIKDSFRAGEVSNGSINATGVTDMVNIERIEVLKGPTAVMFGRGEPGGTVNYVTRRPEFTNDLEVEQRIGNYDFYRSAVHGNWNALPDKLALRLDAAIDDGESFVDIVDGERYVFGPAALVQLLPGTTLLARGEFVDDNRSTNPGIPIVNGRVFDDVSYGRYYGEPGLTRFDNQTWRGVVELEHRWNEQHVSRVTAHGRKAMTDGAYFILFNFAGAAFDPATGNVSRSLAVADYDDENSAVRAEHTAKFALFSSQPFAIDNQLLMAYEHENLSAERLRNLGGHAPLNAFNPVYNGYQPAPLVPFPGFPINFNEETAVDADADSLLVLNRMRWRELVYVTAGARFEWFDSLQSSTYAPGLPFKSSTNAQSPYRANPTVGVVVKPRPFLSLYANYAESTNAFRAFQSATASGNPLEPEQARQWEVGAKSEMLDSRLVATLAAFHIRKSDVVGADPNNPLFSINAGSERSRGIELDAALDLLPGWKLNANYAFTNTRITFDPAGLNTGNRRYGVPEQSGALFSVYELQRGPLAGLGLGAGMSVASQVEIANNNIGELPGYVQTDALVYYKRQTWQLQLNAKNLLDKEYYFTSGDGISAWPAWRRSIIGTLSVKF